MRPVQLPDGTVIDGDTVTRVYAHRNEGCTGPNLVSWVCCIADGTTHSLERLDDEHADRQVRDWAARLMGRSPKRPITRTR